MNPIYHILSSDIPHHNQRVLEFFSQSLLPEATAQLHFFYVVGKGAQNSVPNLAIAYFDSQKAIAQALIAKKRQNPAACFILHGQFNPWIWLAILFGKLPTDNLIWHIWGADLYEAATSWKFKLFYPLRRLAQKRLPQIWATRGDLDYFWRNVRAKSEKDRVIYFPTKLPDQHYIEKVKNDRLTILLGNSGDPSNNHIQALKNIHQTFSNNVRVIVPMGYPANNEGYIQQVEAESKRLFLPENVQIVREKLGFKEYLSLLNQCDLGYFNFERQQGIGTICLLIQRNIPCVLHPNNPFCLDMQAENVPYLTGGDINTAQVKKVQKALETIDKSTISFFPLMYTGLWQKQLTNLIKNE